MGIHLTLYRADGTEEPEWDWIRHAGDRDFWELASSGTAPVQWNRKYLHEDHCFRPTDFSWWREAAAELPNPDRFKWLLQYLEDHPDSWLGASL